MKLNKKQKEEKIKARLGGILNKNLPWLQNFRVEFGISLKDGKPNYPQEIKDRINEFPNDPCADISERHKFKIIGYKISDEGKVEIKGIVLDGKEDTEEFSAYSVVDI